jgi:hypothetical protein
MKRRTAEDWDYIIRDYRESVFTQKEYCLKNNLNYWTFRDHLENISISQMPFCNITQDSFSILSNSIHF